ncbi:TPA: hypothetical protein DEB29_03595 [Candidatus Wolfebacteria bacterium]|nr:hypothetical protein [Candidatus Wolfebacteria bacterium]
MIKSDAAKLLSDVVSALESLDFDYFLIDGTLLGAVREGDFIAHDGDIDLGVYAEEWHPLSIDEFAEQLEEDGIIIHHQFGELDKYFEIALTRDGIKIDLFFYRSEGDKRIFHAFKNGGRNLPEDVITYEYPAELIEKRKPIYFQNREYMAPADPIAVLIAKYGPEWRTPVKEWDWQYGPKNVRK